jgi:3-deoxy-D-manno-octulosonate 8-phosphate phosphatase (KDO 8-P phosphatase)
MNQLEKFGEVDTLLFDVDGVMTDSSLHVLQNGELLRKMHTRDGYALRAAVTAGLRVAVITGGKSEGVKIRLKNLGVSDVFVGIQDKLETYREYIELHDLDEGRILYMGDDLPDLTVMRRVGFPVCPADAAPEIKKISQYISSEKGGHGCVRDVIERVLKITGRWPG